MIRKKQPDNKVVIDLTGPDGNAFVLMAYADRFARKLGLDPVTIKAEMREGDYENLIKVFYEWFGDFVILER